MNDPAGFPWNALGIAPTRDPRLIRAAYAARLKRMDIRADPAAFQHLRRAYEMALGFGAPAPAAAPVLVERNELAAEISALIAAGDPQGAVELLAGAAAGALGFDDLAAIEERLLVVAPELPRARLLALVRRFDWHHATHPLRHAHAGVFQQLDQRLWLEEWRAELQRTSRTSVAALLLIKGAPGWADHLFACWYLIFGGERARMIGWLDRIERTPHAGAAFDPARLRWCRRWLGRRRLAAWIALGLSAVVPVAMIWTGEIGVAFAAWLLALANIGIAWAGAMLVVRALGRLWLGARFVLGKLRRRPGDAPGFPR